MSNIDKIMDIVHLNNGVVTAEELNRLNIHKGYLRIMIEKGMLERSTRGVYILPERLDDEFFNLQNRF